MANTTQLERIGAIERAATLPLLKQLLATVVPEGELVRYAEALGPQPGLEVFGTTRDALDRVDRDVGSSDRFALNIVAGALVRIVAAQQSLIDFQAEEISGLRARFEEHEGSAKK